MKSLKREVKSPQVIEITRIHERSSREIFEGALPYGITYEDLETGLVFTAEGHTEKEAREKLAKKIRNAVN